MKGMNKMAWTSADDNAARAFESGMQEAGENVLKVLQVAVRGASGLQIMSLIEAVKPWLNRQLDLQPELRYHSDVAPFVDDEE